MKPQHLLMMAATFTVAWAHSNLARAEDAKAPATTKAVAPAEAAPAEEAAATATESVDAGMQAVVRGFFLEGRVGGGYMVKNATLGEVPEYADLKGATEALGAGGLVHLAVGYDLTDFLALELIGGATQVSTTRTDYVRDISFMFGGLGLRGALDLSDRLDLLLSGGVAYVSADNQVETPDTGVAALAGVGLEYYVHVRHFSVGLELAVFAPLSPTRVFVSLAPQIKYTF